MRHPAKYAKGLNYIFIWVVCFQYDPRFPKLTSKQATVDVSMAAIGYLLYGKDLLDEVTTNMMKTIGYPKATKILVLILVAVIPITKFPLQYVDKLTRSQHLQTDFNAVRLQ